jgi:iron complex outermembrane recepter protein
MLTSSMHLHPRQRPSLRRTFVLSSGLSSWLLFAITAILALAPTDVAAQTPQDLRRMTLEELLSVTVTTASRVPEVTTRVPAALHVITGEDIRRSGATSLPEALRLAPGVQVARINSGVWSIGMRGFADRLARSMLVLMDGRAVYSPLFAGTYWEVQDTLLEDVERIEVIRGPGGTLWGANAVNGIINIITKRAADTAGTLVSAGGGSIDRGFFGVRHGGAAGQDWHYRVYGKAFDRGSQHHANDLDYDGLRMAQGGFRADWTPSNGRTATVQADLYSGTLGTRSTLTSYSTPFTEVSNIRAPLSGGNVLARWGSQPEGSGGFQVQAFYARTNRDEAIQEHRDTFDVDFQQTLRPSPRHHVIWGLGYRITSGDITTTASTTQFYPPSRTDMLYSGFVQDEIQLMPDQLHLTLGSKIEHNDYTGAEVQPSTRLAWTPNGAHTVWGAITRAVRTPSRVETDYETASLLNPSIPLFVRLDPNPGFVSEKLFAYEAGYRVRPLDPLHVSLAAFYNVHRDVLSTEIFPPVADPVDDPVRVVIPVTFGNGLEGNSYGAEVSADARPLTWWRLTGSYSYLRIQLSKKPGSLDGPQVARNEGLSPRHQALLESSLDLAGGWSLDVFMRAISKLEFGPIPGYATTNVRLAWQVTPRLELAVVGQDLNQSHHVEWASGFGNVGIRRSGYVQVVWRR